MNAIAIDGNEASKNVKLLFDAWTQIEAYRTAAIDNELTLTPNAWHELNTNITAARDAYFHAVDVFIESADPSLQRVSTQMIAARDKLVALETTQENVTKALTLVAQLAGLAGKLLALGAA